MEWSVIQVFCLPFGLKSAPFVFTKILKPVYAWFRQQNIRCCYYMDNSINMNLSKDVCQTNTISMVKTLQNLGYCINHKNQFLSPPRE